MTKLCPRGKAAAKRKFKVYPSAYANAYASKICAGKIKDPSGVKRKDFRGPKPAAKGAMMKAKKGKAVMIVIGVGKKKKVDKKMGGGMTAGSQSAMGRLQKARMMNKGGGADTGTMGERKSKIGVAINRLQRRLKRDRSRLTQSDMERAKRVQMKNKGGLTSELNNPAKGYNKGGDAKIKKVITGLNKASALHKAQAKSLKTVVGKSVGGMADYYKDLM